MADAMSGLDFRSWQWFRIRRFILSWKQQKKLFENRSLFPNSVILIFNYHVIGLFECGLLVKT